MSSSLLAKSVRQSLREVFPNMEIKNEVYVPYKGQRLFFDYYMPSLHLYVEVQGAQHSKFSRYFHGDAQSFKESRKRDSLKQEWCELNDVSLIRIDFDEIPISTAKLLSKIEEAQKDG